MVSAQPLQSLPSQHPTVPWPTDQWPTADLPSSVERSHFDPVIADAFDRGDDGRLGRTNALVIAHHGRIVFERYHVDVDPTDRHISWSMAKSMLHALIGTLVRDGRIDIDEPAGVPGWDAGDPRSAITTRDLLEMRSGLDWLEDYVDDQVSHVIDMLFDSGKADTAAYAAARPAVAAPGEIFNYSSGTSNIVAALAGRAMGVTDPAGYERELNDRLFGPLGMTSAEPGFDDSGNWVASSYVHATARDFLRFGLLYLRRGVWANRPLLPRHWVDDARTPHSTDAETGQGYGQHWWTVPDGRGTFAASGYEGQRIEIVPDQDIVFVRLGQTPLEKGPNLHTWYAELLDALAPLSLTEPD